MADEETKKMQQENEAAEAQNKWLEQENQRIAMHNSALRAQAAQLGRANQALGVEFAGRVASQAYNHANFYTPAANRPSASQRLSRTDSTGSTATSWPPAQQDGGR